MNELISLLNKWQTIIGSILGGIFALLVAFVVASSARRREEISSGMLVIGSLVEIRSLSEAFIEHAEKNNISEQDFPIKFSETLVSTLPKLSPLFESSIARIMPVNTNLATHLTLFHKIYLIIEITIKDLSSDFEHIHKNGKPHRPEDHFLQDAKRVTSNFQLVVEHAKCAEKLISDLILHRFPTWKRFRRFVLPSHEENECKKLLKSK